jgi:agmatinase
MTQMTNTFNPDNPAASDSGIYGLPSTQDDAKVILIPVPFEATTSYGGGTSNGPSAILEASHQVDLFDLETQRPYERGIHMLQESAHLRSLNDRAKHLAAPIIEAAGVGDAYVFDLINGLCDQMNEWVYETAKFWLSQDRLVGVVGGDHSTPFGNIRAHAERYSGLGILHLDAHADLRKAYEGFTWSHASIMYNVSERIPGVAKIVQVGIRDFGEAEYNYIGNANGKIVTFFDAHLAAKKFEGASWKSLCEDIVGRLPQQVYLSFDIDGLDPVLCPNTGTPVPGGLSFQEACFLIESVVKSGRQIVGFDLNEVAPGPDGEQWNGNVGARLLYKMIGWALGKRAS